MRLKSILQWRIRRFLDSPESPSVRVQMAGLGTSVPKGFKENTKATAPDEAGRMAVRRSKEAREDMESRVRKRPVLRSTSRKDHAVRSVLPSH